MTILEECLGKFGWHIGCVVPQYLCNGEPAREQTVFLHANFTYSVFGLPALIDTRAARYALWGFYEEGSLTKWGDTGAELMRFIEGTANSRT
jgi:hypothetical protein